MKTFYRLLSILLIPLFLTYSSIAYAEEKVTPYNPETVESEPMDIAKPAKEGGFKWWYILIGAAVIGGIAAAAGGGGGSSGGSSGGGSSGGSGGGGGGSTGNVTVGW